MEHPLPSGTAKNNEHLATLEKTVELSQDADLGELLANADHASNRGEHPERRVSDGLLVISGGTETIDVEVAERNAGGARGILFGVSRV